MFAQRPLWLADAHAHDGEDVDERVVVPFLGPGVVEVTGPQVDDQTPADLQSDSGAYFAVDAEVVGERVPDRLESGVA